MLQKNLVLVTALLFAVSCSSNMNKDQAATNAKSAQQTAAVQEEKSAEPLVHFDFNDSRLTSEAKKILDNEAVTWLKKDTKVKVAVQGHCDERGSDVYNQKLGMKRAQSVKKYLIKQGIKSSRISVASLGESKPIDSNHNEAAWATNRRVEVTTKVQK